MKMKNATHRALKRSKYVNICICIQGPSLIQSTQIAMKSFVSFFLDDKILFQLNDCARFSVNQLMLVDRFIPSRNKNCTFTFPVQFKWFFEIWFELLLQYSIKSISSTNIDWVEKFGTEKTNALYWKLSKYLVVY